MRKLVALTSLGALALGLSACGSSSTSGTEVLTGSVTGAAAAKLLNSSGNPALGFSTLTLTGPVDTSESNFSLGGSSQAATHTFTTAAGNLVVGRRVNSAGQAQPTLIGRSGKTCRFKALLGSGTYVVDGSKSTGKFAGAAGKGTYTLTIDASANLLPGKTTCTADNTGNVLAQGAAIIFKASGPLTVK